MASLAASLFLVSISSLRLRRIHLRKTTKDDSVWDVLESPKFARPAPQNIASGNKAEGQTSLELNSLQRAVSLPE